jgi:myo-inositol 2-dehydrogenase / D-chiro-inositol 1-dehydrogenase
MEDDGTVATGGGAPRRVLLLGAGRIGRVHARAVSQAHGAVLAGVYDTDAARAAELACSHDTRPVASLDQALASGGLDAVVIGTSSDSHVDLVRRAARAGLHVFCEKPLALDIPGIEATIAVCRENKVALQVGLNRRFDPNALEMAAAVREGRIGRVLSMRVVARDPAPPPREFVRRSGGMFHDMSIHDFDLCRFVLGDDVEEVMAMGACLIDPMFAEEGDVDVSTTCLRFRSGALGVVENTRATGYGYDQRVEVVGRDGALESENLTPTRVIRRDRAGQSSPLPLPFFLERYEEAFRRQMQSFVDALDAPDPAAAVAVTGLDAMKAHRICDAAARSWREHRPIHLPPLEG